MKLVFCIGCVAQYFKMPLNDFIKEIKNEEKLIVWSKVDVDVWVFCIECVA